MGEEIVSLEVKPQETAVETAGSNVNILRFDFKEPLVRKMLERLGRAIASEDMREKMDVEDEIYRIFERELKKLSSEKDAIIFQERQNAERERQNAERKKQKNLDLQKEIEALKKQLKNN